MRTLGVNGSGDVLYLSVADAGKILDIAPYTFSVPAGLPAERRLPALVEEAAKIIKSLAVDRVRILDPESNIKVSPLSIYPRVALETVLALGATNATIDCARLNRPRLRSILSLPKRGQLFSLVEQKTHGVGPYWSPRKRDLAALTALAAELET